MKFVAEKAVTSVAKAALGLMSLVLIAAALGCGGGGDSEENRDVSREHTDREGCDLEIQKQLRGDELSPGDTAVFVLTITNVGDRPCRGDLEVEDLLPPGIHFDSAVSSSGWSCSTDNQDPETVTCGNSGVTLGPGDSTTLNLQVRVGDRAACTLGNTASVAISEHDQGGGRPGGGRGGPPVREGPGGGEDSEPINPAGQGRGLSGNHGGGSGPPNFHHDVDLSNNTDHINFEVDSQIDCVDAPSGMVGWWSANQHAQDISNTGNHGSLVDDTGYNSGFVQHSFDFDNSDDTAPAGESDHVVVPDDPTLNFGNGSLSIDAWVRPSERNEIHPIVFKTGVSADGTAAGYAFWVQGDELNLEVRGGGGADQVSGGTVPLGQWTHVTGVVDRDNDELRLFVNGNQVVSTSGISSGSTSNGEDLFIGRTGAGGWIFDDPLNFHGQVDEVEIFNRAITQNEIEQIVEAQTCGKCPIKCDDDEIEPEITYTGGEDDHFQEPLEQADPRQPLVDWLNNQNNKPFVDFDENALNENFAHSFTDLQQGDAEICEACLTFRIRPTGSVPNTDSIELNFWDYDANGNPARLETGWAHSLWDPDWPYDPGSIDDDERIPTTTICLSDLPENSNRDTDLIDELNQHGFLDMRLQDDTAIDFAELTVEYACDCRDDEREPDLAIEKSDQGPFNPGQNETYEVDVTNAGNAPASGTVTVTDPLPAGLNFVSGGPSPWNCSPGPPVTCTHPNSGGLAPGASLPTLELEVMVTAPANQAVANCAEVDPAPGETNLQNNESCIRTRVTPPRPCRSNPQATQPPPGMVSWWTLDETSGTDSFDYMGSNDGTHVNGPTPTASGQVDGALRFDSRPEFVNVPDDSSLDFNGGSYTIDAWIRHGQTQDIYPIADKWNTSGSAFEGYRLYSNVFGDVTFRVGDGTTDITVNTSSGPATPGQWNHVAAVWDRGDAEARIFVNGTLEASQPIPANLGNVANSQPLIFADSYVGILDEIEFFDRALGQGEIQSIYDAAEHGKCKDELEDPDPGFACESDPNAIEPPSGMVGWWSGDQTAADYSPEGNHGSLTGGAGYSPQIVDHSFVFGGAGDRVEVPDDNSLDIATLPAAAPIHMTVDAWINPDTVTGPPSGDDPIVDKRGFPADGRGGYYFFLEQNGRLKLQLTDISGSYQVFSATGPPVPTNQWTHVAASVEIDPAGSTTVRFYRNGNSAGTQTEPVLFTTGNQAPLWIGESKFEIGPGSAPQQFDGQIDEVELFDRVVPQSEIQSIAGAGRSGKCKDDVEVPGFTCTDDPDAVEPPSGMVSWWTLDETSGTDAFDYMGSNDGTHINGPTPTPSGQVDGALEFNSLPEFVNVPDDPSLDFGSGSYTIDAWINHGQSTDIYPIVDKWHDPPAGFDGYLVHSNVFGDIRFRVGDGTVDLDLSTSSGPATPGQWNHIAAVWDRGGNEARIFVNGALEASQPIPANLGTVANNQPLVFADSYFGVLDEIEFFDRALSQSEIQSIYAAAEHGKCKDNLQRSTGDNRDEATRSSGG